MSSRLGDLDKDTQDEIMMLLVYDESGKDRLGVLNKFRRALANYGTQYIKGEDEGKEDLETRLAMALPDYDRFKEAD